MLVWLRKKYYNYFSSESACEKRVRRLLDLKVQSPFDKNDVITLGDIIFSTAMTEKEILDIARSYGIDLPSKAIDITPDKSLEYLLYHGKDFQYTFINSMGEKVVAGIEQIGNGQYVRDIPLIPDTHLGRIIETCKHLQEGLSSFYGHVSEYAVRDTLVKHGYQVFVPAASNTPGYDLCVEKSFFDNYGLDYVENPDMPGYGFVQVKSTIGDNVVNYTSNTLRHFENYPDIPVIASNKIVEGLEGIADSRLISFKAIGIPEKELQESVMKHFDPVTEKILPETFNLYKEGLDATHFSDVMDNSIDALTLSDFTAGTLLEHLHIPTVGIAIAAGISSYRQYRMVKNNQINWTRASANIAKDTGKTAIISTTTIGLTSLASSAIGISATKSFNGITEWAIGDSDLDLSDVGELGAYILIATGIGYGIKKMWNWIVGDPFEELKKLVIKRKDLIDSICNLVEVKRDNLVSWLIPPKDVKLEESLINEIEALKYKNVKIIEKTKSKVKPLSYYVIKEKMSLLQNILNKLIEEDNENTRKVEDYIDRILNLAYLAKNGNQNDMYKTKQCFCEMYQDILNKEDITAIKKNINSREQVVALLYQVLNKECKNLLVKIESFEIDFKNFRKRLDWFNCEVSNEEARLRAAGKM